jgi:3-oxoisoapionate kinase
MLLLSYYGDDFTGSTDVMEALQWAGLRTVLFLAPPTPEQLGRIDNLRAFGVAGWGRTMSVDEMNRELRPVLAGLRDAGAPWVHYKICSTFDSSPEVGSLGRVLELGHEVFGADPVPILAGAPSLGRYQVFGNLFARSGLDTEPFRLDRHPTMQRHPITPMDEADLRLHLARQTSLALGLVDVLDLENGAAEGRVRGLINERPGGVLLDVLSPGHLPVLGRLFEEFHQARARPKTPAFVIGSSGVEYALTAHWQACGRMDGLRSHAAVRPGFGPAEQLIGITGSCSPVNQRQLLAAGEAGFELLALDPTRLVNPATAAAEVERSTREAVARLERGANLILHSSLGPDDPRVTATLRQYAAMGFSELDIKLRNGRTLGPQLGRILKGILKRRMVGRVAVAGGDTSGYVARELGIEALEAVAPVAPGCPLCRVLGSGGMEGMEILFKGGQVGRTDNVVILALPDRVLGQVAKEVVPQVKAGCLVMTLDPAAAHAGELPPRPDISYFVSHPCHPSVFDHFETERERDDFFGGTHARQAIVCALMQGPEAHYELGERVARDIYAPVTRAHRITVEQMAILEPAMAETVGICLMMALREALEEAVRRGVPRAAAEDFMFGHVKVELGIAFGGGSRSRSRTGRS